MQFGRYELVSRLAVGGMGEVFRARVRGAEGFQKPIALKRIFPHLSEDPKYRKLFVREAKLTAQLLHPNIAQVYELGENEGQFFIAMEYVSGADLTTFIKYCKQVDIEITVDSAAIIAFDVLEALDFAHNLRDARGDTQTIVHRDVSPSNILIDKNTGFAKLCDFGVAHVDVGAGDALEGHAVGKVGYMPPEQIQGKTVDARADIWSLGVSMYETLTGLRFMSGENIAIILDRLRTGDIPSLGEARPDLPEGFTGAIDCALNPDPEHRFQSADSFRSAVEAFLSSRDPRAARRVLQEVVRNMDTSIIDISEGRGDTEGKVEKGTQRWSNLVSVAERRATLKSGIEPIDDGIPELETAKDGKLAVDLPRKGASPGRKTERVQDADDPPLVLEPNGDEEPTSTRGRRPIRFDEVPDDVPAMIDDKPKVHFDIPPVEPPVSEPIPETESTDTSGDDWNEESALGEDGEDEESDRTEWTWAGIESPWATAEKKEEERKRLDEEAKERGEGLSAESAPDPVLNPFEPSASVALESKSEESPLLLEKKSAPEPEPEPEAEPLLLVGGDDETGALSAAAIAGFDSITEGQDDEEEVSVGDGWESSGAIASFSETTEGEDEGLETMAMEPTDKRLGSAARPAPSVSPPRELSAAPVSAPAVRSVAASRVHRDPAQEKPPRRWGMMLVWMLGIVTIGVAAVIVAQALLRPGDLPTIDLSVLGLGPEKTPVTELLLDPTPVEPPLIADETVSVLDPGDQPALEDALPDENEAPQIQPRVEVSPPAPVPTLDPDPGEPPPAALDEKTPEPPPKVEEPETPTKTKTKTRTKAKVANVSPRPPAKKKPPPKPKKNFGTLNISVRPWAKVVIDGVALPKTTPIRNHRVSPGQHTVVLKGPNGEKTVKITVGPGESVTKVYTLE